MYSVEDRTYFSLRVSYCHLFIESACFQCFDASVCMPNTGRLFPQSPQKDDYFEDFVQLLVTV